MVDAGSVTAASPLTNVTQPSLSRQLRLFERDLGITLFTRAGGRLVLSAAGRQFVPIARDLVRRAEAAAEAVASLAAGRLEHIRIAAPGTTFTDVLAPFLATLHPDDPLPAVSEEAPQLIYATLQSGADLAISTEQPPAGLASQQLAVLPIWAYVPPEHDWAAQGSIAVAELVSERLLLLTGDYSPRRVLDRCVDRAGLTYSSMLEFGTPQVAQAVAAAGRGIAVVSDDPRFGLHPLDIIGPRGALHIRLYAAWDREHHAATAIGDFAGRLGDYCITRYGPQVAPRRRRIFTGGMTSPDVDAVEGTVDEALAEWVAALRLDPGPSCQEAGVRSLRQSSQARAAARPPGPGLALVQDLTIDDSLRGRLYRSSLDPRPLVLFIHGGGFVKGDLNSHDRLCRRLAKACDVCVLAVDYRRAPEFPAPAAVDDAVRAIGWAVRHRDELGADPQLGVALVGDSSGGAIAALTAIRLRDGDGPAASALLLICPNTDLTLSLPSVTEEGQGWGLDAGDMRWLIAQWVPDPNRRGDPQVSPLFATLRGLPPTVVATADHDPLRDEGDVFAHRLLTSGVPVQHLRFRGMVHGFINLDDVSPAAARAGDDVLRHFARLLPRSSDS